MVPKIHDRLRTCLTITKYCGSIADEIGLTSKELSEELKLVNLEMRAGMLRRDALRNLAKRTDLEALNSLVTLLTQTEKFGTSIVQALRIYSEAFRIERFQRAEEIAGKLPVILLFPLNMSSLTCDFDVFIIH